MTGARRRRYGKRANVRIMAVEIFAGHQVVPKPRKLSCMKEKTMAVTENIYYKEGRPGLYSATQHLVLTISSRSHDLQWPITPVG